MSTSLAWHRVASTGDLPEGRVMTVVAGHRTLALTHHEGRFAALDNACPHQGGPLGEGSIEGGWLRCPWHGWDFHPCTGKPPGGYDDGVETCPVEVRGDEIWVGVPVEQAHRRTVTDVMAETLVNWGVRHVFGMVGHSNLGLADALRRQEEAGRLSVIGVRHEGAAAFAASAYGKLTGRPAACLTIAGPGATNLLTGLWDAKVDRAPVLALTGQVDTQVLGPGAFQEIDLAAAFAPVAGWSQTVLPDSRHAELMSLALKHAIVRRNVAHLIFPDEVQTLPAGDDVEASGPSGRVAAHAIAPPDEALDAALERIRAARRPVVIVGHGARFVMEPVLELAERLNAPVLTTFKAKGQVSDLHPLGCGVLGRSGTPIASWFMNECDLLIVFGASFSNHTGIARAKPTIQVDFEAMALGKFHAVDVPVWGEIGVTAHRLLEALETRTDTVDQREEVAERWRIWREEKRRRESDDRGRGVGSAAIFAALTRQTPEDAVIAVDVGNNTYSFGRYFECARQSVLMSGYLGSIGFGFPAAMGAWAAAPERKTISISGDGGFAQYMGELTTAVQYGMDITHVLLNNGELGKISKEQRAGHWDVFKTSLHNPDFSRYAENCGARGIRITRRDELDDALAAALATDGPALVEVVSDAELV
ncbi:MAG: thiamine pyrophosphate-binding protein [Acidobacteria bacterium]|nr:MAG: thiamine pyrophosphate-binding protein [Acidobacteriota bacterium]